MEVASKSSDWPRASKPRVSSLRVSMAGLPSAVRAPRPGLLRGRRGSRGARVAPTAPPATDMLTSGVFRTFRMRASKQPANVEHACHESEARLLRALMRPRLLQISGMLRGAERDCFATLRVSISIQRTRKAQGWLKNSSGWDLRYTNLY